MDVCITKDHHLVLAHNLTLDAYANVPSTDYQIGMHDLAELEQLNMGYNFKKNDSFPYRNILDGVATEDVRDVLIENGLKIVTIEELFAKYASTDLKYIIEIKNSGELGKLASRKLYEETEKYNLFDKVVVGTFHDEIEAELKTNYPKFMRGASLNVAYPRI